MVKRNDQEDNIPGYIVWLHYFRRIKSVCPWSYESFLAGNTKIVPFDSEILKLSEMNWDIEPWEVIVYVVNDLTLDEIDKFVAHRNDSQEKCEYLWSHPTYTKGGGNQAPYPIIIQQDRERLMELRYGSQKKKTASG